MTKQLRKMKKFRFQLLDEWLTANHQPCSVADIGGGKGLLALLLIKRGWDVTIIDPTPAGKAPRYRDPETGKQIKLTKEELTSIPRINQPFQKEMAKHFDLLIGMHAHGSNMSIIESSQEYGKDFIIFPCCVIGEPIIPQPNINWLLSLEKYAGELGHSVRKVQLNFRGQNIGLYNFEPTTI